MYIKSISLKNFKCYENIDIDFNKRLSVIIGVNGAGKTTILEGLAVALSSLFVKMDKLSAVNISKDQAHKKAFVYGNTSDIQEQYPIEVSASAIINDDGETKDIAWTRSLNSSTGNTLYGSAQGITSIGVEYQNRLRNGDSSLMLPLIAYYGTGRLWDYHREKQSDVFLVNNRLNGYLNCMDGTANIKLMMNWFSKMTIQKYQNQELGLNTIPELEAVYNAMEKCYQRITGCDYVKMQYNMGNKELDVAYKDANGVLMRLPINQLSDGYKGMISLVADIAYRMAVLNPQLGNEVCEKTNGVVLIDEVDLHLHPQWQQRVLGDLIEIFPNVQFIVTSHAPSVISSAKSENLIVLENGEIIELAKEVFGMDSNSIVDSLMQASERPVEVKALFKKFYGLLDNNDIQGAESALNEIKVKIDSDDYEIVRCEVKLRLKKAGQGK